MRSRVISPQRLTIFLMLSAAAIVAHAGGDASSRAAVARGEFVAREMCAGCHRIASAKDPSSAQNRLAPSLRDIADRPGLDERALRQFVASTHWEVDSAHQTMPNPHLTRQQAADVVQYIVSLRTP